jgi:hypothetical protein
MQITLSCSHIRAYPSILSSPPQTQTQTQTHPRHPYPLSLSLALMSANSGGGRKEEGVFFSPSTSLCLYAPFPRSQKRGTSFCVPKTSARKKNETRFSVLRGRSLRVRMNVHARDCRESIIYIGKVLFT